MNAVRTAKSGRGQRCRRDEYSGEGRRTHAPLDHLLVRENFVRVEVEDLEAVERGGAREGDVGLPCFVSRIGSRVIDLSSSDRKGEIEGGTKGRTSCAWAQQRRRRRRRRRRRSLPPRTVRTDTSLVRELSHCTSTTKRARTSLVCFPFPLTVVITFFAAVFFAGAFFAVAFPLLLPMAELAIDAIESSESSSMLSGSRALPLPFDFVFDLLRALLPEEASSPSSSSEEASSSRALPLPLFYRNVGQRELARGGRGSRG